MQYRRSSFFGQWLVDDGHTNVPEQEEHAPETSAEHFADVEGIGKAAPPAGHEKPVTDKADKQRQVSLFVKRDSISCARIFPYWSCHAPPVPLPIAESSLFVTNET